MSAPRLAIALATVALLLAAAGSAGAAERRSPHAGDGHRPAPSQARDYWTRERMLEARPADFPTAGARPFAGSDRGSLRGAKPEGPRVAHRGRRGKLEGYSV